VVGLHAVLFLVPRIHPLYVSRLFTAAVPMLAAFCGLWRAQQIPARERLPWRWFSASLLCWAAGPVVDTLMGPPSAAFNSSVNPSDFLYIAAAFPLLLAVSHTRRTESIQYILYLDILQVSLALVLSYFLVYRMAMPTVLGFTVIGQAFAAECVLLAVFAVLRLFTWFTLEERRRTRLLGAVMWIYVPVELGMEYATRRWNLHGGTPLDLLWSAPFLFAGWQTLHLPMDEMPAGTRKQPGRAGLLAESLCPTLITACVFTLAASIATRHPVLGLAAILFLLLNQGLHSGLVQVSYLASQNRLLEREQDLQKANTALERLSLLDALTGIPNRRRFGAALNDAWRRAVRKQEPLAILMIDVDFFKAINDRHGHAYGDQCLTLIAAALSRQTRRPDDLLARYGGEEFVILLPDTGLSGAMTVAERVRYAVYAQEVPNDASPHNRRLTVSVGIGICHPKPSITAAAQVEMADQALYEAKQLGRNRICMREL
jgi:diguanylate cyclase (GGDEF)-like protein